MLKSIIIRDRGWILVPAGRSQAKRSVIGSPMACCKVSHVVFVCENEMVDLILLLFAIRQVF